LIRDISAKIEEKTDRTKVLKEHLKNVQQELLHTQALVDYFKVYKMVEDLIVFFFFERSMLKIRKLKQKIT